METFDTVSKPLDISFDITGLKLNWKINVDKNADYTPGLGWTNKTWSIDISIPRGVNPYTFKKIRKIKPVELNIHMPKIPWVSLDGCGSEDNGHYEPVSVTDRTAHTHKCPYDPNFNMICMYEEYLRNSDGTLSDMFWHEYAHVFSDYSKYYPLVRCGSTPAKHSSVVDGNLGPTVTTDWGHGEEWAQTMKSWGFKPSRFVDHPY